MARGEKQKVFDTIMELLEQHPEGVEVKTLVELLKAKFSDLSEGTLRNYISFFRNSFRNQLELHERGFLKLKNSIRANATSNHSSNRRIMEEDFYKSFAEFLVKDLKECTKAIPLGGNKFQDKWGTPDVLGVYRFSDLDPIKPTPEIVSAEIKLDSNQIITAFGQACAYKIFSHKVYLVIPSQASDILRIESLCLKFGLGLVLFNNEDPENPNYEIRARALKNEPDYFYLNEYLKKLTHQQKRELFG